MVNESCQRYQESYGESSMPPDLARHGESCPECRAFVQRQQSLRRALSSWSAPDISPDFTLGVMARLAEKPEEKREFRELLADLARFRFSVPLPVGALAMLLLLLSIGTNVMHWFEAGQTNAYTPPIMVIAPNAKTPTPEFYQTSQREFFESHEWTGTGAFLLIPMVDGYTFSPVSKPTHPSNSRSDGI